MQKLDILPPGEQQSTSSQVPSTFRKFNWGAFFLTWIWALGNRSLNRITIVLLLLCLVPYLGVVSAITLSIYSGVTGSDRAWQNNKKRWKDLEHFQRVQKRWAIIGLAQFILVVLCLAFLPIFYVK